MTKREKWLLLNKEFDRLHDRRDYKGAVRIAKVIEVAYEEMKKEDEEQGR